jgi:hypothetical protein
MECWMGSVSALRPAAGGDGVYFTGAACVYDDVSPIEGKEPGRLQIH